MSAPVRTSEPTPIRPILTEYLRELEAMAPEERARHDAEIRAERDAEAAQQAPAGPKPRWPDVPERFAAAAIDTYAPENDSELRAQKAAARWVGQAGAKRGVMLALIGATGTGKSHLLWGASHALRALGAQHYARPWYLLADELRYGGVHPWSGDVQPPEACRHALWHSRRILLLDEIDFTSGTDFDRLELKKLVHHAWDQKSSVLVTSPVAPLEQLLGPQAASRFVEIHVTGRDRRTTKAPPKDPA